MQSSAGRDSSRASADLKSADAGSAVSGSTSDEVSSDASKYYTNSAAAGFRRNAAKRLKEKLNLPVCSALILLLAGFYIFQRFSLSIQALQTALFPLVLLLLWRAVRNPDFKLPLPVAIFALCGWAVATLNIHGYLPSLGGKSRVYLALLDEDDGEKLSRSLMLRYNSIAQAYALPKMELVLRRFSAELDAAKWLDSQDTQSIAISGDPEWLRVTFPRHPMELGLAEAEAEKELADLLAVQSGRWGIDLKDKIKVVVPPGLNIPVLIAVAPEQLYVPDDPQELSRHFIAWLAQSVGEESAAYESIGRPFSSVPAGKFERLRRFASREDAVAQTGMMLGAWHSPEPISLARFLAGTLQIFELIEDENPSPVSTFAAVDSFNGAQKMLRPESNADLISLIRNNSAMARLMLSPEENDLAKIRRDLLWAGGTTDPKGMPTRGARIAMLNLMILEKAGLL